MSIKGFPSSQKLPLGTGITNEFVTVQPLDEYKYGLDVSKNAFRVGSDTVPRTAAANTGNIDGMTWIYDTANPAKKGDFVRFETGSNAGLEVPIVKVETNRFLLGALLNSAPVAGNTYYIMRYSTQRVNSDGTPVVSISPSPIEFVKDGVNTQVNFDSTNFGNNIPLPTLLLDPSGAPVDSGVLLDATINISNLIAASALGSIGPQLGVNSQSVVPATGVTFPVSGSVSVSNFPATQPVSGSVSVSNFPATQPVSGSVSVSNFPATQAVTGTFWQTTQPVSGSVSVSNFPATQPVSGTVAATQSGTWNIGSITNALPTGTNSIGNIGTVSTLTTVTNAVPTKSPVNSNGSIVNTSLTGTTASTATVPANAVGFVLEAPSTNTDNIRYAIGGTASTTVGMLMEPGRDTGFIPCAANISICSTVSGTNAFSIQWILSA